MKGRTKCFWAVLSSRASRGKFDENCPTSADAPASSKTSVIVSFNTRAFVSSAAICTCSMPHLQQALSASVKDRVHAEALGKGRDLVFEPEGSLAKRVQGLVMRRHHHNRAVNMGVPEERDAVGQKLSHVLKSIRIVCGKENSVDGVAGAEPLDSNCERFDLMAPTLELIACISMSNMDANIARWKPDGSLYARGQVSKRGLRLEDPRDNTTVGHKLNNVCDKFPAIYCAGSSRCHCINQAAMRSSGYGFDRYSCALDMTLGR